MCMEREEDAKALASCKELKLRGELIQVCIEKVVSKQKLLGSLHVMLNYLSYQICFFEYKAKNELIASEHEQKPIAKK